MLDAQVVEAAHGHTRLSIPGVGEITAPPAAGLTPGRKGAFAIRPEQVRIGKHSEVEDLKNHFPGEVRALLYSGDVTTYKVQLAEGTTIEALLPNYAPGRAEFFETGDEVQVGWRHDAGVFLYD